MNIFSINIHHGGGNRIGTLLSRISSDLDVLILSEFRDNASSGAVVHKWLAENGYAEVSYAKFPHLAGGERSNRVLVASKASCSVLPETQHIVGIELDGLRICGIYMPQKKEKRPVFELLLRDYARQHSCVLIGDFNTGKTAADIVGSKLRFSCEDMFCDIESSMTDAWRHFYPERRHFSWDYFKGGAVLSRWRIDHAFLSPDLVSRLQFCEYDDAFRVRAPDGSMLLSDHSGLMLKLL